MYVSVETKLNEHFYSLGLLLDCMESLKQKDLTWNKRSLVKFGKIKHQKFKHSKNCKIWHVNSC